MFKQNYIYLQYLRNRLFSRYFFSLPPVYFISSTLPRVHDFTNDFYGRPNSDFNAVCNNQQVRQRTYF